jgi:hypothetical protein
MDRKDSIYGMDIKSLLDMTKYYFGIDDFDNALMLHHIEITRTEMGGSKGIHKIKDYG